MNNMYGKRDNRNRHPSYLSYLEISIVEHCNLNCAGCSNFSPLAKEHFADLEIFERSIEKLANISKRRIDEIRLIGGEPLLNPNVIRYFEIIKNHLPKTKLSIFSNGLLLNKQSNAFFDYIKNNKVTMYISDYFDGITKMIIDATVETFSLEHNIVFIRTNGNKKEFNNLSIDKDIEYDSKNNYEKCFMGRSCLHMRDDTIFICPVVAHIDHFNRFFNEDLSLTEEDFINIDELNSLGDLIEFLNKKKENAFCKHCDLDSRSNNTYKMRKTSYDIYEWYKDNRKG